MTHDHTPGPYQVANFDEDKMTVDVETVERGNDLPEKGILIARCYCLPDGTSPEATLLSAAPEMLEALESCLAYVYAKRHYKTLPDDGAEQDYVKYRIIKPAIAAIAKAKGLL